MNGFSPERVSLVEAARIVAERASLPKDAANPIYAAIDENALTLWEHLNGKWEARGGEWYRAADVWRPHPLIKGSGAGASQVSVFDILVKTADIDQLWPSPAKMHKNKGGHPGKWDWEGALIEAASYIYAEGMPDQTELKKHISHWFSSRCGGDAPDDGEVRKRVKRLYDEIDQRMATKEN